MRIGELATRVGCDVQTIRFYEREGLLDEPRREPSGYLAYAAEHVERLQFIRHCRSLDIPLPEIRSLIGFAAAPDRSCAEVNALLDSHIGAVQARLAALKVLEQQLVSLRRQCDGDPSHACAILQSFMRATGEHACACHPAATGPIS